jgi:hypothetical protein
MKRSGHPCDSSRTPNGPPEAHRRPADRPRPVVISCSSPVSQLRKVDPSSPSPSANSSFVQNITPPLFKTSAAIRPSFHVVTSRIHTNAKLRSNSYVTLYTNHQRFICGRVGRMRRRNGPIWLQDSIATASPTPSSGEHRFSNGGSGLHPELTHREFRRDRRVRIRRGRAQRHVRHAGCCHAGGHPRQ